MSNRTTVSSNGDSTTVTGTTSAITEDTGEVAPKVEEKGLLAGKYKTAADLEKAYKELESKLGKTTTDTTQSSQTQVVTPATKTQTDALEIPLPPDTPTPLDLNEFSAELSKDGKLSDASYQKLAKRGIPKEAADVYVAGLKAQAEQRQNTLAQRVGGKDALSTIFQWASQNLSKDEITTINTALKSGNNSQAELALDGLSARYTKANGSDPKLTNGEGARGTSGVQPFESNDELVAAMRDPRYRTSEGYRATVEKRILAGL